MKRSIGCVLFFIFLLASCSQRNQTCTKESCKEQQHTEWAREKQLFTEQHIPQEEKPFQVDASQRETSETLESTPTREAPNMPEVPDTPKAPDETPKSCKRAEDCDQKKSLCLFGMCIKKSSDSSFQTASFQHTQTGQKIPYQFFVPSKHAGQNKYPLMVALHGLEYFASPKEQFLKYPITGYMALGWMEHRIQSTFPMYVLAPHLHKELKKIKSYSNWQTPESVDFIKKLIQHFISNQKDIDTNRIYLTGHSMGGAGTWSVGAELKDVFAALIPLSSAINSTTLQTIQQKINSGTFDNIPIWKFIHRSDDGSKNARKLFSLLSQRGISPLYTHTFGTQSFDLTQAQITKHIESGKKHLYTEYSDPCTTGLCHFAMHKALREPLLLKWLIKQKKR